MNGNIHGPDLGYKKSAGSYYLLGLKYAPLRKAFWSVGKKDVREDLEKAIITFGGHDAVNMTPFVVSCLSRSFPGLRKSVIIGKNFTNIPAIERAADNNTELIHEPDAEKIKEIMTDSDIAFSNGGQTIAELARVGVPVFAILAAENQRKNIKKWEEKGFLEGFEGNGKDALEDALKGFMARHGKCSIRAEKAEIGRRLVDGNGAKNIVDEVLSYGEKRL